MNLKPLVLGFSLIAFAGAAAAAGDDAKRSMSQSGDKAAAGASAQPQQSGAMSAKKLIGTDVVDAQGKDMGEIKDVVLDLHNARVHAAVLEFGGFLGVGEKQYAFPVSELKPAKEKDKLVLNVDKEKLKNARGFEKDKWPAMGDDYWGRIGKQEKAAAGAGQPGKVNLMRASELMGRNVQDSSGKDVGEVKDVILSSDRGRIQHFVVELSGRGEQRIAPKALSLGTGDKLMIRTGAGDTQAGGSAAAGASAAGPTFSELDKDNDGTLSQIEAAADANAKSSFQELDKNKDEKLSREEWEAGQRGAAGASAPKSK